MLVMSVKSVLMSVTFSESLPMSDMILEVHPDVCDVQEVLAEMVISVKSLVTAM